MNYVYQKSSKVLQVSSSQILLIIGRIEIRLQFSIFILDSFFQIGYTTTIFSLLCTIPFLSDSLNIQVIGPIIFCSILYYLFFYLDFLSQAFTNHRTAGEGGGHFFKACICYFHHFFFFFSPNDSPSKTMKNVFFISSKKLFSFLRYLNFCIFVFPSFFPCQPLLQRLIQKKS